MEVSFFMPKYMADFKCVGEACKDTCCAGWEINIDKITFDKYKNSNGDFEKLVLGKYRENPIHEDDSNYGFMNINSENKCPFLNGKLLCDIHGEVGEENLSITCKKYPRIFNIVDSIYEKSGIPSCEEVCLKAFLNKEKMEFVELEEKINENEIQIGRVIDTEAFIGTESLLQYFWDIRINSINIMQMRKFKIEERLNILKEIYCLIEKLKDKKDFEEIESILESLDDGSFDFDSIKGKSFENNSELNEKILDDSITSNIRGVRLKEFIEKYKIYKENNNIVTINTKDNLLEDYSHIFENYLVNQIFKDVIPFNKGGLLNKSIEVLINTYKVIKSYIIGFSMYGNIEITESLIIRVIQALSKDLEHNKVFNRVLDTKFI